jgi:hypothetical protein
VMGLRRLNKLQLEVTAQAYPYRYYVDNENAPADRPSRGINIKNPGGVGLWRRVLDGRNVIINGVAPVVGRAEGGANKNSITVKVSLSPTDKRVGGV